MYSGSPPPLAASATSREPSSPQPDEGPSFDTVYQEHAPYVWRAACRLGIGQSDVEDVVQDTFLVVHRRLSEYEARSSMRVWLFAILVSVVRDHRRTSRLKPQGGSVAGNVRADGGIPVPLEERMQAILDAMNDARREVFVLMELEGLSTTEAAQALGAMVNTVHFRLRAARRELENVLARRRGEERQKAKMKGLGPEARALVEAASRQDELPSVQSLRRVRRSITRRAMVASAAVAASSATTLGATAGLVGASVTLQLASLALAGALAGGAFLAIAARWRDTPRLAPELQVLHQAQEALLAGRATDVLSLLDRTESAFRGRTTLEEEARTARVAALCQLGRDEEARREMATMPQRSPAANPLDCARAKGATPGR